MKSTKKTFQYGEHQVTIDTGALARQADGAVMVDMAETQVMVTAVGRKAAEPGRDFFPLTVNYQEKTYAAGKIPGGFFKREGRPSEKEILVCRLIDRPIRPLFPKGFTNEVQVIANVMSLNPDVDPDIPALLDLALSAISVAGFVWAASRTGSVFLATWCFFLVQALFIAIPPALKRKASAVSRQTNQSFDNARRRADAAIRQLANR